jgi:GTPase SAR1 family protein
MAEEEIEYISYKKVIIFGVEGSGKSTLSKSLETGKFSEQTHTYDSKYIQHYKLNLIFFYSLF